MAANTKKEYKTKQRNILLDYMMDHREECLSARDLIDSGEVKLGEATIYRQLVKLADEGYLRRFIEDGEGKGARYQYADKDECDNHFHLKCVECDCLIHTDCEEIEMLEHHLKKEHGFQVDSGKTVIYGLCEKCSEKRNQTKQANQHNHTHQHHTHRD